jgi:hypothetical protein
MNNVINLKGQPVEPPAEGESPIAPQADILLAAFLQAVISMHQASLNVDFSRVALRDEQGRIWSAPAVMRMIDRHMEFIRLKMGKDFKPANPRR